MQWLHSPAQPSKVIRLPRPHTDAHVLYPLFSSIFVCTMDIIARAVFLIINKRTVQHREYVSD